MCYRSRQSLAYSRSSSPQRNNRCGGKMQIHSHIPGSGRSKTWMSRRSCSMRERTRVSGSKRPSCVLALLCAARQFETRNFRKGHDRQLVAQAPVASKRTAVEWHLRHGGHIKAAADICREPLALQIHWAGRGAACASALSRIACQYLAVLCERLVNFCTQSTDA
jgi:hypothetical protein